MLTPGIRFLGSVALPIGSLVLLLIGFHHYAAQYGIHAPSWAILVGGFCIFPMLLSARLTIRRFRDRVAAQSLGARLIPTVRGKYLGNFDVLRHMIRNDYPGDGLGDFIEEYGPVVNLRVLWQDINFTICPEHIKLILATDFQNYVKGHEFDLETKSVLGTGVFNSDGDMWKFHRNLTRPHFNREKITDFDLFDQHAEAAIELIKERGKEGFAVDFQDVLHRFTLDTATQFLLGSCVHTLRSGLPYPYFANKELVPTSPSTRDLAFSPTVDPNDFAAAFQQAQHAIANREKRGWVWPLFEIFQDATIKPMKIVNTFVEPLVQEAIERHRVFIQQVKMNESQEDADDGELTLLDQLVKKTSDPKIIKDETLNILVAGRDTTASTLTFVMHFLTKYPTVLAKLLEEIMDKVGSSRRPTFDDIKDMKYLRAVINETLRLYPVVPFNVRTSVHATTWPSPDPTQKPLYIPANSKIPYSVFMMHRRKDLWGPDAEEFDPDRWFDKRLKKYLLKNHFIFLPFNAGPRICLGQQFAYNEMSYMLIKLLQTFSSFTLDTGSHPPDSRAPASWASAPGRKGMDNIHPRSNLTMYIEGGLWIRSHETPNAMM